MRAAVVAAVTLAGLAMASPISTTARKRIPRFPPGYCAKDDNCPMTTRCMPLGLLIPMGRCLPFRSIDARYASDGISHFA